MEPYVVVGFGTGFSVVDVSDPTQPNEVSFVGIPEVVTVNCNSSQDLIVHSSAWGIVGYTLDNPAFPREVSRGELDSLEFTSAFSNNYLYIYGFIPGLMIRGIYVFDVSHADNIREVNFLAINLRSTLTVVGDKLYGYNYHTLYTIDISDPANPAILDTSEYAKGFVPLAGFGNFLLGKEDEIGNGVPWIVQSQFSQDNGHVKIPHVGFMPPLNQSGNITIAPNGETFLFSNSGGVWTYGNRWGARPYMLGHFDTPGYAVASAYGLQTEESQPIYVADGNSFLVLEGAGALTVPSPISPVPSAISLSTFPNPFNSTTTISFSVGVLREAPLRLAIYDISGHLVADLSSAFPTPHSAFGKVVWDASGVGAGIYFLKAHINGQNVTQKLVLVR